MQVLPDLLASADLPRGGVATIGNYDGLHRGQRAILERVVARAKELGVPSLMVTFEPLPLTLLRPEAAPPRLLTPGQREALLEELGLDYLAVVSFTAEVARTPAERFVRELLHGRLGLAEVLVGRDFVFGHEKGGNFALLETLGAELGFAVEGLAPVVHAGERISASRIRRAVAEGRLEEAAELLGRPYSITGVVVRGDRMGKRIGWPTINLASENELIPADGVYAGQVRFAELPSSFDCATNVGTRPTVYENYRRVVESHILDFSADVYGQRVELAFCRRLRDERIFASVMDLSAQIRRDVEATREYFAARRRSLERAEG